MFIEFELNNDDDEEEVKTEAKSPVQVFKMIETNNSY